MAQPNTGLLDIANEGEAIDIGPAKTGAATTGLDISTLGEAADFAVGVASTGGGPISGYGQGGMLLMGVG